MSFLDFNLAPMQGAQETAPPPSWAGETYDRDEVHQSLIGQIESVLGHLYPHGFADPKGRTFYVGNVNGDAGESLNVVLTGGKAGQWYDFATGDGGDIFDLWRAARGLPSFRETLRDAALYSGAAATVARKVPKRRQPSGGDAWGAPACTYRYLDAQGNVVAEVDRFEWEKDGEKKKAFRPWNVATKRHQAPETRPLYNLPNIINAPEIIVVEGEKAADALIAQNINATTAMGGAQAPLEKTDWSIVRGRVVKIWPDNDDPGRDYAERLKAHLEAEGAASVSVLQVPTTRPAKWDAADAEAEDLGALIRAMQGSRMDSPPQDVALEWFADIQPALGGRYLVKGVLDTGTMSAIYGPSNSGKTFFALDLAFHIATGQQWRGHRVNRAAVLYLAAEGGRGVQNRIAAIKSHTGVEAVPMALRRAGLDLLNKQADLQRIYDLSIETRSKAGIDDLLIVVDTLSRAMAGGDENSPADMTALIKNVDMIREATGAHVMLVHHTGKDTTRGARGHSSLRAALDTEIEIQSEDNWRAALVTKQRDNPSGQEFPFVLEGVSLGVDQDGDEVASCVVVDGSDAPRDRPKKLTKNQRVLAEVYDMLMAERIGKASDGGPLMPPAGQFWLVPMEQFRTECEGKMTAKNTRDGFLHAFDTMNGPGGMFCMASGFVWRTDRRISR